MPIGAITQPRSSFEFELDLEGKKAGSVFLSEVT